MELLDGAIGATVAIFERLKQAGVPVCALSNYNREKFDIARMHFPFLNAFDELDAEIFELLIHRRGLDVGRTVFIDDSADNGATANQLGLATIHFNETATDLRAELLRLGLKEEVISGKPV